MPLSSHYLWFHRGTMAGCLAETLVLALDESAECFSLGRNLEPAKVEKIGQRAIAHGFSFSQLYSFGLPLDDSFLTGFRKALRGGLPRPRESRARWRSRRRETAGRRWKNSGARRRSGSAATSIRRCSPSAEALSYPWSKGGEPGSGMPRERNTSTSWPAMDRSTWAIIIRRWWRRFTPRWPKTFPALRRRPSIPLAAALAEQLATITPAGLEMVFFANSGAEAVEAGLKLARRATGRAGLLYCERSFHGKTLGALSVTGNRAYQRPFEPLVPDCQSIPFGNAEALERALSSRQFAALVVEPVQAEGGMIVPPRRLPARRANALCRETGTLLMVDEVQTGFGRTGHMFAVDGLGVEPDLMAVAKSLSGGLVPIGAMLARRRPVDERPMERWTASHCTPAPLAAEAWPARPAWPR